MRALSLFGCSLRISFHGALSQFLLTLRMDQAQFQTKVVRDMGQPVFNDLQFQVMSRFAMNTNN